MSNLKIDYDIRDVEMDTMPRSVIVKLEHRGILTLYACNNYNDTSPVWELIQEGEAHNFLNTQKESPTWVIGVRVQVTEESPGSDTYTLTPSISVSTDNTDFGGVISPKYIPGEPVLAIEDLATGDVVGIHSGGLTGPSRYITDIVTSKFYPSTVGTIGLIDRGVAVHPNGRWLYGWKTHNGDNRYYNSFWEVQSDGTLVERANYLYTGTTNITPQYQLVAFNDDSTMITYFMSYGNTNSSPTAYYIWAVAYDINPDTGALTVHPRGASTGAYNTSIGGASQNGLAGLSDKGDIIFINSSTSNSGYIILDMFGNNPYKILATSTQNVNSLRAPFLFLDDNHIMVHRTEGNGTMPYIITIGAYDYTTIGAVPISTTSIATMGYPWWNDYIQRHPAGIGFRSILDGKLYGWTPPKLYSGGLSYAENRIAPQGEFFTCEFSGTDIGAPAYGKEPAEFPIPSTFNNSTGYERSIWNYICPFTGPYKTNDGTIVAAALMQREMDVQIKLINVGGNAKGEMWIKTGELLCNSGASRGAAPILSYGPGLLFNAHGKWFNVVPNGSGSPELYSTYTSWWVTGLTESKKGARKIEGSTFDYAVGDLESIGIARESAHSGDYIQPYILGEVGT